ncbi:MAG: SH3 domain-containing protein [Clostridia bacterium]|nr:SH3 domain-containing protein [Clostridia bacterium]
MTFDEDAVWINLSHLVIRPQPDFETEKIGNIPYGTKVMGEIDGNWMFTSYNGVEGYIYIGKMKSNDRPCVVYSASDLQPLD